MVQGAGRLLIHHATILGAQSWGGGCPGRERWGLLGRRGCCCRVPADLRICREHINTRSGVPVFFTCCLQRAPPRLLFILSIYSFHRTSVCAQELSIFSEALVVEYLRKILERGAAVAAHRDRGSQPSRNVSTFPPAMNTGSKQPGAIQSKSASRSFPARERRVLWGDSDDGAL